MGIILFKYFTHGNDFYYIKQHISTFIVFQSQYVIATHTYILANYFFDVIVVWVCIRTNALIVSNHNYKRIYNYRDRKNEEDFNLKFH